MKSRSTIVDLFSGCGGFSLGAELAGFHSIIAVDIDPTLQSAFRLNFPKTKTLEADVSKLDASTWRPLLGKTRVDGLIGGPPCQGFSRIGRRTKNDPRNYLVWQFYRQVKTLKPRFFVMENVEGLLDDGNLEILKAAINQVSNSYVILGPIVINSSQFGAPTSRRRVVVIGYDPEEVDTLTEDDIASPLGTRRNLVKDAISDLPSPHTIIAERDGVIDFGWSYYPARGKRILSEYALCMRARPPRGLGWQTAVKELKEGRISGFFGTRHSPAVIKRFANIKQGKSDQISKCPRLAWDGLCPTLRAGTGTDRGSFQSVRPIHPSEPRVITVREAARLQGFPDWYVFHPAKWHSFRMIGNSVSPIVSEALLSVIKSKFL